MSDPRYLKPYRNQAWVANIGPPLFLSLFNEFSPEGGMT